jgi:hypothetical protein
MMNTTGSFKDKFFTIYFFSLLGEMRLDISDKECNKRHDELVQYVSHPKPAINSETRS